MEDSQIIELFFNRSEGAIQELSAKYGRLCLSTAQNITGNTQDAQECTNDAYWALWNAIPPARPKPLLSFLLKIVRNLSMNRVAYNHAQKRYCGYDECIEELNDVCSPKTTPEAIYDEKELAKHIGEFVARLDRTNRMLFIRRYWYMDSYETLSAVSGLRQGAIRTRLSRIREQLRKFLLQRGITV